MKRVFVTDGSYRNALAAVRALGVDGWRVTVGERAEVPASSIVASWSRYCTRTVRYPDPRKDERAAVAALRDHFAANPYDAVIPVSLDLVELFVRHGDALDVPVMLPPPESFAIAADKRRTFEHAREAGIPIPQTVPAARWEELALPLVLKHPRTGAAVARTREEALAIIASLNGTSEQWLAQDFVPGENGFGYFALFDRGRERGYFMHERLRQFPREGGPSVIARAIHDDRLRELGRTLLESLQWHGVAMVEFKRSDRDGEFYLMEINPKFWGSLGLAIAAGANFPVWVARALAGDAPPAYPSYERGVTYQWVVPIGIKSFVHYPNFRFQFVRNVLSPRVKTDVHFFTDPLPTAAGILGMAGKAGRT